MVLPLALCLKRAHTHTPVALDDQGTLKNRQQQGGGEGFSNRGKWRKPDKCLLVLFPSIPAKGLMPSFLLPSLPVGVPTTPLPAAGGVGWGSLMGKMAKLYPANAIVFAWLQLVIDSSIWIVIGSSFNLFASIHELIPHSLCCEGALPMLGMKAFLSLSWIELKCFPIQWFK